MTNNGTTNHTSIHAMLGLTDCNMRTFEHMHTHQNNPRMLLSGHNVLCTIYCICHMLIYITIVGCSAQTKTQMIMRKQTVAYIVNGYDDMHANILAWQK
jgi:hypothetical protein